MQFGSRQLVRPINARLSSALLKRSLLPGRVLCSAWLVALSGCSPWSATALPELPVPLMPHDSIVLEAAFVRVPADQDLDELWLQVDEQHLATETRRNLAANGIRSGVMGTQLPRELQELIVPVEDEQAGPTASDLTSNSVTSLYRRLQNRAGEPADLVVVPTIAERKVILFSEQGHIRAETFENSQALFVVRGYPSGDGTVRMEMVPEIRYGDVKHQWAPGKGTFLHDAARPSKSFDQLRVASRLSPGNTLLITGTDEPRGLGGLLFARGSGESSERLILLLRLAQTQYDDLFAPERAIDPLATPID